MKRTLVRLRFVVLVGYLVILITAAGFSNHTNSNQVSAAEEKTSTTPDKTTISISATAAMTED